MHLLCSLPTNGSSQNECVEESGTVRRRLPSMCISRFDVRERVFALLVAESSVVYVGLTKPSSVRVNIMCAVVTYSIM